MKSYKIKVTSEVTMLVSAASKEDARAIAIEQAHEYDAKVYSEVLEEYDLEVTE